MPYSIARPWGASFILCSAFLIALPCAVHAQAPPEWAQERLSAWYAAFNAGDAAAVASLYAPEAVRLPPDGEPMRGRAAIEEAFAERFRMTRFECEAEFDGIQVIGDLGTAWGHDRCTITPKSGEASETTASRWLVVFHRQGDDWFVAYTTSEGVEQ